jgi:hypothetical protein
MALPMPRSRQAGASQDRVKRGGELPGPVTDQEPEIRGAVTEVHQEIADLLRGPRPVRVRGHPKDMHVAAAGPGARRCRVRAFARGLLGIWRPFGSFAGRRVTYGPAQVTAGG